MNIVSRIMVGLSQKFGFQSLTKFMGNMYSAAQLLRNYRNRCFFEMLMFDFVIDDELNV